MLVNTLTFHDKYFLLIRENLKQPIGTELSQQSKTISLFFTSFLNTKSKFEKFENKHDPHSLCISEITECETCG